MHVAAGAVPYRGRNLVANATATADAAFTIDKKLKQHIITQRAPVEANENVSKIHPSRTERFSKSWDLAPCRPQGVYWEILSPQVPRDFPRVRISHLEDPRECIGKYCP